LYGWIRWETKAKRDVGVGIVLAGPPVEGGVTSVIDGALIGDAPIVEIASGGDQMNGISRIEQNTK